MCALGLDALFSKVLVTTQHSCLDNSDAIGLSPRSLNNIKEDNTMVSCKQRDTIVRDLKMKNTSYTVQITEGFFPL